jgi:signal transduction histidine kinase
MRLDKLYVEIPAIGENTIGSYAVSAAAVLIATAARLVIDPYVSGVQYITYYPAVIVTALLCGRHAGLASVVLSLLAADYFIIPPRGSIILAAWGDLFGLGLFAVNGATMVILISAMRYAIGSYRELSQQLEQRVQERSSALLAMNTELMLAKSRAEEASRAKSAFLANMSHELRTPLNAILGFSEIIRDKMFGKDADRYSNYAADIYRSGEHLLNIVNEVLDVTLIEAGRLELHEEQCPAGALLNECLVSVERQALIGGVTLASNAADLTATLVGDRTKLKQIFLNLLANAIKFTPECGSISIFAHPTINGGIRITVRDTGIGMTKEEARRALELFHQVDGSLSRKYQGTGLGLPLAVRYAKLHGGTLKIKSVPGKGTSVMVTFPSYRVIWPQRKEIGQNSSPENEGLYARSGLHHETRRRRQ